MVRTFELDLEGMHMQTLEIIGDAFRALPQLIVINPTDPDMPQRFQYLVLVIIPIPLGDTETMHILQLSNLTDIGDCRVYVLQYRWIRVGECRDEIFVGLVVQLLHG